MFESKNKKNSEWPTMQRGKREKYLYYWLNNSRYKCTVHGKLYISILTEWSFLCNLQQCKWCAFWLLSVKPYVVCCGAKLWLQIYISTEIVILIFGSMQTAVYWAINWAVEDLKLQLAELPLETLVLQTASSYLTISHNHPVLYSNANQVTWQILWPVQLEA